MSDIELNVIDLICREEHITDKRMQNLKQSSCAFYCYMQAEQLHSKHGIGFKTTFEHPLIYPTYESLMMTTSWVDEIDFATYYDAEIPNLRIAERSFEFKGTESKTNVQKSELFDANKIGSDTPGKWRVLEEMLRYADPKEENYNSPDPIKVNLTVKNIKMLGDILARKIDFNKEINDNSTLDDIDELIEQIRKNETINVLNVPLNIDLVSNQENPFYPPALYTAFTTLSNPLHRIPGIVTPYLYYSSKFSHTVMHIEDRSYASMNVNLGPGSNLWILINESDLPKYVEDLRKSVYASNKDCPGFVRSKAYLVTCKWLRENKISFRIAIQRLGEMIITPANALHQVICLGECFKQGINFPDSRWFSLTYDDMYVCSRHAKPYHGTRYPKAVEVPAVTMLKNWNKMVKKDIALKSATTSHSVSSVLGTKILVDVKDIVVLEDADIVVPDVANIVSLPNVSYKRARKSCTACEKSFADNRRLQEHFTRIHGGATLPQVSNSTVIKDKICPVCRKAFQSTYHLSRHTTAVHPNSKVEVVYKRKSQKSVVNAFKCPDCEKSYPARSTLKRHIFNKHE